MLLFFLTIVAVASGIAVKLLWPEMAKPAPKAAVRKLAPPEAIAVTSTNPSDKKVEKLEALLYEKNRHITLVENELKSFQVQARNFDKLKNLLDEEILRLREQNRILRSELGMPTVPFKENIST
jgi:hypothetical protein